MKALAALTPSGQARVPVAWALYDFANTVYSYAIVSYAMGLWAVDRLGPADGQFWFGVANALSVGLNAAVSPVLGAVSDRGGRRLPFLAFFTAQTIIAVTLIGFLTNGGGQRDRVPGPRALHDRELQLPGRAHLLRRHPAGGIEAGDPRARVGDGRRDRLHGDDRHRRPHPRAGHRVERARRSSSPPACSPHSPSRSSGSSTSSRSPATGSGSPTPSRRGPSSRRRSATLARSRACPGSSSAGSSTRTP